MKKRYMILAVLIAFMLALPILLIADSDYKMVTVARARQLGDDAKVALEGFIIEDMGDEMYLFRDGTGDIDLEIDDDVWGKRLLDPDQMVMIHGEIDRDDDLVKVEVDKITDVKEHDKEEIEDEFEDDFFD